MKKTLLLVSAILIASIPFVFAGPGEGPGAGGHEGPGMGDQEVIMEKGFNRAIKDLKLTPEQEQKLREIRDSSKREIMVLKHEIQLAILDIQEEYKKAKSDAAKIDAYIDKLSAAQKKLMKIRSAHMLKMKEVLTPEQFRKFTDKIDRAKGNVKKGFFDRIKGKK